MCGRFDFHGDIIDIEQMFAATAGHDEDHNGGAWQWAPHYNIAPTMLVPVVCINSVGERRIVPMHFGMLMPDGRGMQVNARSETVTQRGLFNDAFVRRRCLVPAHGFYEWQPVGRKKQPYYAKRNNAELLGLAGIWAETRGRSGSIKS